MLQQSGDHAGAVEAFSIALRKDPKHVIALQNLILSFTVLKKHELALERLTQLPEVDAAAADRLDAHLSLSKR